MRNKSKRWEDKKKAKPEQNELKTAEKGEKKILITSPGGKREKLKKWVEVSIYFF